MSNTQAPPLLEMTMIDMSMGPVHISSGPGSDSRSMSLTILLSVLEKENNVIWMTRNLPDQRKIIDIYLLNCDGIYLVFSF